MIYIALICSVFSTNAATCLGLLIDSHIFRWEWKTYNNFGLAIIKFSVGMEDIAQLIK